MEKQTVLILETVLISIWLWKCPFKIPFLIKLRLYIRDVFEKNETVPILETVLILEMKEYLVIQHCCWSHTEIATDFPSIMSLL